MLLDSEIVRIRAELGYSVTTVSAEPYVGFISLFTLIIQPFLSTGALTSSSTSVASSGSPASVIITVADATGISVGNRVFVDVDDPQETATVRSVSGTSIGLILSLAHAGTYPVGVDSGEEIVREILKRIRDVKKNMADSVGAGSLKNVDEIGWYPTKDRTLFGNLSQELFYWRSELSQVLSNGQDLNLWAQARSGSSRIAVY